MADSRGNPPISDAPSLADLFLHQVHRRGQVHDLLSRSAVARHFDEFFLSQDARRRAAELRALGLVDRV